MRRFLFREFHIDADSITLSDRFVRPLTHKVCNYVIAPPRSELYEFTKPFRHHSPNELGWIDTV